MKKTIEQIKSMPGVTRIAWRNWLLPFIITLITAVLLKILFSYLPENALTSEFFAGWASCVVFYTAQEYCKIKSMSGTE